MSINVKETINYRNALGKLHLDPVWVALFEQRKEVERQMDRLFDKYFKIEEAKDGN